MNTSITDLHQRFRHLDGLIFDKDGTLFVETPELIREYQLAAVTALTKLDTRITMDMALGSIEASYRQYGWSFELLRRKFGLPLADVHFTMHSLMTLDNIQREPDLADALKLASQRGLHFSIATHCNRIFVDRTLPHLDIDHYFHNHHIMTLEKNNFKQKSDDASMVLETARMMGLPPQSLGFVENSTANLLPAKRAGFITILVTWGQDIHAYDANHLRYVDMVFETPMDVLRFVSGRTAERHVANDMQQPPCATTKKHGLLEL